MKKTKLLAFILSLIMVVSTFAVAPLTVFATEATSYQSTLVPLPAAMKNDCKTTTDEVWSRIEDTLKFNVWQNSYASPTTITENATEAATVKIANDEQYIYFYVEQTGNYGQDMHIRIAYGDDIILNAARKGGTYDTDNQIWINSANSTRTSDKYGSITGYVASGLNAAKTNNTAIYEGKFTMPETLKEAVLANDVDIKISMFLRTDNRQADNTTTTGGSWTNGLTTDGCEYDANSTDTTKWQTVTLKQAISSADRANPIVSKVMGAPMNVNGKMDAGEGWAELPYAVLDKMDSNPYNAGGLTNVYNVAPAIRLSTDGDYLYAYAELTDEQSLASNDTDNQLYMMWKFSDTDYYRINVYTSKALEYEGTGKESANTTYNTSGTPLREFKLGDDSEDYLKIANVLEDGKRTIELALKLSPAVKSALMEGDVTAGFAAYMRTNIPSQNYGYTSDSCLFATGDYWADVAKLDNMTLPSYNSSRPVIAGAQTRESATVENAVDVRFVAALSDAEFLAGTADACKYSEAGFDFTSNGKTVSINCWNLYKSLLAAGEPVTPDTYGGDFFFCYTIQGLEAGNSYDFSVKCWTKEADADKVYSAYTYDVTVAVNANGVATITSSKTAN